MFALSEDRRAKPNHPLLQLCLLYSFGNGAAIALCVWEALNTTNEGTYKPIYEYAWTVYLKKRRPAANGYQTPYEIHYGCKAQNYEKPP